MSRFSGRQDFSGPKAVTDASGKVLRRRLNKGVMASHRDEKRREAEERNAHSQAKMRGCGHRHGEGQKDRCEVPA